MKTLLRISLIAAIALTINACGSKTPSQTTNHQPEQVTEKLDQSEAEKPNDTEEVTISEDSIRREMEQKREREREGYAKEQERFEKVLNEASDKELLIVLKYAIAHRYVPNRDIDPYGYVFVGITPLHRTFLIYDKLSDRKDLLQKIYPDVKVLGEYIHWGRQSGKPYPDAKVSQAILDKVGENSQELDSIVGTVFDKSSLAYK